MHGFKPFGKGIQKGFSFPSKAGFTSSSGKTQEIKSYSRRVPAKKHMAEGGRAEGAGPVDKEGYTIGQRKSSPGVGGALRDAAKAIRGAIPKGVPARQEKYDRAVNRAEGYADGGSVGNSVVKRGNPPITDFDTDHGGTAPLRTGYAKGGKPKAHGVKPGRSFDGKPLFGK